MRNHKSRSYPGKAVEKASSVSREPADMYAESRPLLWRKPEQAGMLKREAACGSLGVVHSHEER